MQPGKLARSGNVEYRFGMNTEYEKKTVLITGGGSGIGKETARLFCSRGASVYIAGRDLEKLEKAAAEINAEADAAGRVGCIRGDVALPEECGNMVEHAVLETGALHVLVNSAGVWSEGDSDKVTEEEWDRVIDSNLKGTFFMCRYAIPALEKTEGSIVNISSDSGLVGNDRAAVYCASKGGVTLLTKALAVELGRKGIRVNAVCPGDVASPMLEDAFQKYGGTDRDEYYRELLSAYPENKNRRFTSPREVAEAVLFLASKRVSAVTGACLSVDFGLTAGY